MKTNYDDMTITLRRIDVCNLLLACTNAEYSAFPAGNDECKWAKLHDILKEQLDKFDNE